MWNRVFRKSDRPLLHTWHLSPALIKRQFRSDGNKIWYHDQFSDQFRIVINWGVQFCDWLLLCHQDGKWYKPLFWRKYCYSKLHITCDQFKFLLRCNLCIAFRRECVSLDSTFSEIWKSKLVQYLINSINSYTSICVINCFVCFYFSYCRVIHIRSLQWI